MSINPPPLVSIVTPAHNEAEYLAECIESVKAQTYQNWDYTIVDNCSTDESLTIARRYAAQDSRIRVVSNNRFLPIIENHNEAIRQISPQSKYCKFVFADDWLYPTCIAEMVQTAEKRPSIGLVGAYGTDGRSVLWTGVSTRVHELRPPCHSDIVPGRQVCRDTLLGGPYLFGSPTSLLIRSDLIRKRDHFFNEQNMHADNEACFDVLQESDFGFVHQVLTFTRPRTQSTGAFSQDYNSFILGDFVIFLKYGPLYLNDAEYQQRLKELRVEYHHALARNVLRLRPKKFWKYHTKALTDFNGKIDRWLLAKLVVADLAGYILYPRTAAVGAWRWWRR